MVSDVTHTSFITRGLHIDIFLIAPTVGARDAHHIHVLLLCHGADFTGSTGFVHRIEVSPDHGLKLVVNCCRNGIKSVVRLIWMVGDVSDHVKEKLIADLYVLWSYHLLTPLDAQVVLDAVVYTPACLLTREKGICHFSVMVSLPAGSGRYIIIGMIQAGLSKAVILAREENQMAVVGKTADQGGCHLLIV